VRLGHCTVPDWPAPAGVHALITSRMGGVSEPPFDSLNLALHVGDRFDHVLQNRAILRSILPADPCWLGQVKSLDVIDADLPDWQSRVAVADAIVTSRPDIVCAVLSADELPLLLVSRDGSRIGAVQAGWRSLSEGLLSRVVRTLRVAPEDLLVYLGPALGPAHFRADEEMRTRFLRLDPSCEKAFRRAAEGHLLADIYLLARQQLQSLGTPAEAIHGGAACTFSEPVNYFSKARDGATGRMASMIWRALI
jgi:YfiH family protein